MPWLRLLLAALLIFPAVGGCGPRTASEPVWVGQLVPLNGADRAEGEQALRGVRLAVDEARKDEKTVAGHRIAVRHADSRDGPDAVQAETVRLVTVNRVAALITGPEARLAERVVRTAGPYGVPVVVPGELADPAAGDEVVSLGAPPGERGRALARYAAKGLKGKRVAVLTDGRSLVGTRLASAFLQEWRGAKGTAEEWTFAEKANLKDLAERVLKAKSDVVVVAGPVLEFHRLRGQLLSAGLKAPMLYGGPDVDAGTLAREATAGPDVYLATVYAPEGLTARGQDFARQYQERFHTPPDLAAAAAYDGARLLFDAMQRAQSVRPERLREELAKRGTFESVTGPVSWKDREPRRRLFVVRLAGSEGELVKTVEPEGK